jgi:hypothetical protein
MSHILRASWGVFCVIFGIVAILWISYLLFIDNVERIEPKGFVFGYLFAGGAIAIGIKRIRRQPRSPSEGPATRP